MVPIRLLPGTIGVAMQWIGAGAGRRPSRIVAFDFETTGLDPVADRPVQVGVCSVSVYTGKVVDTWDEYIDPEGVLLHPQAAAVNGLNDADLARGGRPWSDISARLALTTEGALCVAQRVPFDVSFWREADLRHGLRSPQRHAVDTKVLAGLCGAAPSLPKFAAFLGLQLADWNGGAGPNYHNARDDATVAALCAYTAIKRLGGLATACGSHDRMLGDADWLRRVVSSRLNERELALYRDAYLGGRPVAAVQHTHS